MLSFYNIDDFSVLVVQKIPKIYVSVLLRQELAMQPRLALNS
jgi:hypothetical protein